MRLLLVGALLILSSCGFEQVDEGYRGIKTSWGSVVGEPLAPGLHFYNPISGDVFELPVREEKAEGAESCFTRDTQRVDVTFAITYYPRQEKIGAIYSQFGKEWAEKIVFPVVKSSIKDVIGQYIADDLVSKREIARDDAFKELKASLEARNIVVTRLDFVNLDFDDAYENAVESKVVAVQKAAEAKNKTVQVEEEAKQVVMTAKSDAEAMKIKSEALSKNQGLVQYEAIQKWNGALPKIILGSGSLPILDMKGFGLD